MQPGARAVPGEVSAAAGLAVAAASASASSRLSTFWLKSSTDRSRCA